MKFVIRLLITTFLLSACSAQQVQSIIIPTIASTSSPTVKQTQQSTSTITTTLNRSTTPLFTETPIPLLTATITGTPIIRLTETEQAHEKVQATIDAYGTICNFPEPYPLNGISPDGRWIAMQCKGETSDYDSYLRVVSINGDKDWIVPIKNFTKGLKEFNAYNLFPFHWSKNGKYLFFAAASRMSGCCWIGDLLLLARLNLENGEQTEIANFISDGSGVPGMGFSISSSDRYVIISGGIHIYLLDLLTWKQRVIDLKYYAASGYTLMSNDDSKIILIIRQYPENYQPSMGDVTYGSIVIVDLVAGVQKKILSGYEWWDTPQPYAWKDNDHVVLCRSLGSSCENPYLLLNINTGVLTEVKYP